MDGSDLIIETANTAEVKPDGTETSTPAKKKFIAPEISVPVDVLEATTFFQLAASGGVATSDLAAFLRWKVRLAPIPVPGCHHILNDRPSAVFSR